MHRCAGGTGESLFHQALRVSVPPRVADGARFRFRLKSPGRRVGPRRTARRHPLVGRLIPDSSNPRIPAVTSHVDFLGVLFIVWGLLTVLVGVSTLALGVGAVALIDIGAAAAAAVRLPPGVTAVAFTTLALIAIVWGAAHVVVGVPLRRHTPWSRLIALMLGSVDLLLLPYGTALGVYAL